MNNDDNIKDLTDFQCQRCGACCCWPGDVRVSEAEQNAIAAWLGLNINTFLENYTRLASDRRGLSLIDNALGHCVFYTPGEGCRINPVKPRQCTAFPYEWNNPGWQDICAGAQNILKKKKLPQP